MPIYEFICDACNQRFETLISIGGEINVVCDSCGSPKIRKLVSSFGIGGCVDRTKSSSTGCSGCSATSCSTCR